MKLYVCMSAHDYEGWSLPDLITDDVSRAMGWIRDAAPPSPTETYEVYEYELNQDDQGEAIAWRSYRRPVQVKKGSDADY